MSPAAELDSGRVDDGENTGGGPGGDARGCDMSRSLQTNPSGLAQGVEGATPETSKLPGKMHACLVCGKVYTYMVSFRKHQRLHEKQPSKESSVQNLTNYQCPDCGLTFIRRARLLGHLKVHRSDNSKPPRCDRCNKDFISVNTWMAHVDLHRRKPFWCLSCARGFKDEALLDKHMQSHDLRTYGCNICPKKFCTAKQLRVHHNSHTGARPYPCTFCGKRFSQSGNLNSHLKRHLAVYVRSSGRPLGARNYVNIAMKPEIGKSRLLASVKEEQETDTSIDELPRMEEGVRKNETEEPCEDFVSGHHANPEVSDWEEAEHHFKISKPPGSAGSVPPDEFKSETVQPPTGQGLDEREPQERNMLRERKYWQWECVECDMGFDEVAELHSHYIKHATGELPMRQDDVEG
ncbi:uncharacterized protein PEZ65_006758 [Lycodopsis pacificus]